VLYSALAAVGRHYRRHQLYFKYPSLFLSGKQTGLSEEQNNVLVGSWAGILDEIVTEASMLLSIWRYGWKNLDRVETE
jgi:hypothetical protein